jgi:hypothetical protein
MNLGKLSHDQAVIKPTPVQAAASVIVAAMYALVVDVMKTTAGSLRQPGPLEHGNAKPSTAYVIRPDDYSQMSIIGVTLLRDYPTIGSLNIVQIT